MARIVYFVEILNIPNLSVILFRVKIAGAEGLVTDALYACMTALNLLFELFISIIETGLLILSLYEFDCGTFKVTDVVVSIKLRGAAVVCVPKVIGVVHGV
jgi:hypothetical protein